MTFSPAELKRGGRSLPTSRSGLAPAPNPALYLKSAERCFIMGITSVIDQTVKAIHSGEQRKKAAAEKFAPLKTRKFVSNGFDLAEEFLPVLLQSALLQLIWFLSVQWALFLIMRMAKSPLQNIFPIFSTFQSRI